MSGTWVVAGAADAASVARPVRPLFQGGFGSLQLAVRRERLVLGSLTLTDTLSTSPRAEAVLGNSETATTLGAAWHLNRWIAIEGNLIHEAIGAPSVTGDAASPDLESPLQSSGVHLMRPIARRYVMRLALRGDRMDLGNRRRYCGADARRPVRRQPRPRRATLNQRTRPA